MKDVFYKNTDKKPNIYIKGVIIVGIIIFILTSGILMYLGFVNPIKANINRKVFENTNSYNRGKIQQLTKLKYEYSKGTDDDKKTIKALVRIEFANYNKSKLVPELRNFIKECNR